MATTELAGAPTVVAAVAMAEERTNCRGLYEAGCRPDHTPPCLWGSYRARSTRRNRTLQERQAE